MIYLNEYKLTVYFRTGSFHKEEVEEGDVRESLVKQVDYRLGSTTDYLQYSFVQGSRKSKAGEDV